uniref:Uncharacterized protein n=1 Tax=uncultured marine virus TaxID=186617 RepID=A0A0F7L6C4_9VIRU|nr:hypothetical protein [uncultured marine virus]
MRGGSDRWCAEPASRRRSSWPSGLPGCGRKRCGRCRGRLESGCCWSFSLSPRRGLVCCVPPMS